MTPFSSNMHLSVMSSSLDRKSGASPAKGRPSTPGKIKDVDGKSREMTTDEMKDRFIALEEGHYVHKLSQGHMKTVDTNGAWSNREEEWFFNNKRLLLAAKSAEVVDQWIEKLSGLVTE